MDWVAVLGLIGAPFAILLVLGMPVGFTFLFIMLTASIFLMGSPLGPHSTILSLYNSIGIFSIVPVPLFVLMGNVLLHSGLAMRSIEALGKVVGRLPARLAILSNLAGGLFGLLSGSTMASTAVIGQVLGPEMRKRGYAKAMTYGPILASGGLAMVIPPSSLAIIYGTVAEVPIGRLLIAGLIPGFLMMMNYIVLILVRVKINPSLAPEYQVSGISVAEKIKILFTDIMPLAILVFLVTGVFVIGLATPTEAAALGALGTIVVAKIYKCLTLENFLKSVKGTVSITAMVLLIVGGSDIFSRLLSYSGATRELVSFIISLNLPPYALLAVMMFIILVLGCFMESVPIMMVTIPLFAPIVKYLGFDPIWFGVIMLICLEIGLTTPPFGLLLFVLKGVASHDVTTTDLYRAALPFVCCDLFAAILVISFPPLALWLPNLLM
ncbi:MAG: TRAP transporter large permease [Bacillota bacterium]